MISRKIRLDAYIDGDWVTARETTLGGGQWHGRRSGDGRVSGQ